MIIIMKAGATREQIAHVEERIRKSGYKPHSIYGEERTVIGAVGDERGKFQLQVLESIPAVERVVPILKPFKLAGREWKEDGSVIKVDGVEIGGDRFVVMAGPCSVESREQIMASALAVKDGGACILRGGAFKPRTSPYDFQGLAEKGLKLLRDAKEATGLPIITEVIMVPDVEKVAEYADILQIGARNMQNFGLLNEVGKTKTPVLLKRGMSCTVKELLMAAEYIMAQGNYDVLLCERGIRTFEEYTRNTLDLSAVPLLKELSHLPVIVDPNHGTGVRSLVAPMAYAAVAAGADGLLMEVHPNPEEAWSDGPQSLFPEQFSEMMETLRKYCEVAGRRL